MKIIVCYFFFLLSMHCTAQVKSGLLLYFGIGDILNPSLRLNNEQEIYYKCNAAIGYRFRLPELQSKRFFYDLDMIVGLKWLRFNTFYNGKTALLSSSASDLFCPVSIAATFNYKIIKGLYVGAGVTPTAIFASKTMFDIPVIARVGYNINNKIEFAVNYQYSMLNAFKTDEYKGGRFSEWNISVYIPFTLSGKR